MSSGTERVQLALMLAGNRGEKSATATDFAAADRFLDSELVRAHDRRVAREAVEDAAAKIPEPGMALLDGGSATEWLVAFAKEFR